MHQRLDETREQYLERVRVWQRKYQTTDKCRLARAKRRLVYQKEQKDLFHDWKESRPCMDCGQYFRYFVMELDHVKGDKVGNISAMIGRRGSGIVDAEVNKCDLVCANCHRMRTAKRKGW